MSKLDRLGWAVQHSFDIAGAPIGIRTTSAEFGAWLAGTLASHRGTDDAPLRYSIVAADRREGHSREYDILYRGCSAIVRTLHRQTLVAALLDELEAWGFRERDDAVFLRMAPIAGHGVVALVPAYVANTLAGQGRRSTKAGITLPAQHHVAVDVASGAVIPIPRTLTVAPSAIAAAGALGNGTPDRLAVREPLTADGLVFFAESGALISQMSQALALYRTAGFAFNLPRLGGEGLRGLGRLVAGARCVAVNAVESQEIVDAVSRALAEIAAGRA